MVKSVLAAASFILLCFPLLGKDVRFLPLLSRPNDVRFLSRHSHCILLCAIAYQPRPWILRSSSRQLGLNLGSPALSFLGARHAAARHSYYYVLREDHCGLLRTVHIKPQRSPLTLSILRTILVTYISVQVLAYHQTRRWGLAGSSSTLSLAAVELQVGVGRIIL